MKTTINLDFSDMEPFVLPFSVGGKEYELREPTCLAKKRYTNERLSRLTMHKGVVSAIRDLGDLEPILIASCTFEKGAKKSVEISLVESWPARITHKLFEAAKSLAFEKDEKDLPVDQLIEALEQENSPFGKSAFLDWVKNLPPKYEALKLSVAKELDPKEQLANTEVI